MSRWFVDDPEQLRWRAPFYLNMSQPMGGHGQAMPENRALHPAKYGKKVLLERIVRLVLAIELRSSDWLTTYVSATRSLHGELPLCREARDSLEVLQRTYQNVNAPLVVSSQVQQPGK